MEFDPKYKKFYEILSGAKRYREIPVTEREHCRDFEQTWVRCRTSRDPDEIHALKTAYALATIEVQKLVACGQLILDVPSGDMVTVASEADVEELVVVDEDALGYPIDPAAEIIPPMRWCEFHALLIDIQVNGQRESIVLRNGSVIDGRHRLLACKRLGIEPRFVDWDGVGTPEEFVLSVNVHRRHLSNSKRAFLAAKTSATFAADAKKRSLQNLRQNRQTPERLDPAPRDDGKSIERAAKKLNVSPNTVKMAAKVLKSGIPALEQAVVEATISLDAAATLAALPKDKQVEIIRNGDVKNAVKQIRDKRATRKAKIDDGANTVAATATMPRPFEVGGPESDGGTFEGGKQSDNGELGRSVLGADVTKPSKRTLRIVDKLTKEHGPRVRDVLLNPTCFSPSTVEEYEKLDLEAQSGVMDILVEGNARPIIELLRARKPVDAPPPETEAGANDVCRTTSLDSGEVKKTTTVSERLAVRLAKQNG